MNIKRFFKSKIFFLYSVLAFTLLSWFVVTLSLNVFEQNAYDWMLRKFTAVKPASSEVVVIVVDDKSVGRVKFPWKRQMYGQIFEYLNMAGARVVGFDALVRNLDTDNPASDTRFFNTINSMPNLVAAFSPGYDSTGVYEENFARRFAINITDKRKKSFPAEYSSVLTFPNGYLNAIKNTGSVNVAITKNNHLWLADQIVFVGSHAYPSFAMRMYLLMHNTNEVEVYDNRTVVPATGLAIPTLNTSKGIQNFIGYYKLRDDEPFYAHKKYSAIDIIDSFNAIKSGRQPAIALSEFAGKAVVIGIHAAGTEDSMATPIQDAHPGVDIQATFLDNLMNDDFMDQTPLWFDILLFIFLAVSTFKIISTRTFLHSFSVLIAYGVFYYLVAALCFQNNFSVPVLTPLLMMMLTMIFAYSYRFITEGKNKEKIKSAMGKYLSHDIMQNVVRNIDDIKLGGKRAHVTVLFSDIRGFTSMSEQLSAIEVSTILNEYFSEMEPIITKYNGVINKFIGDAIMAIFGEPVQDINHPVNAVKCAKEMLECVDRLQQKWLNEGKPKIEIGVGISTGEVFVGNVGSENRLEYTVIGDTVNLASRLESYNKVYKTRFLISSSTYSYVTDIADVIKISEVTIRGKADKMDIYEVLRLS